MGVNPRLNLQMWGEEHVTIWTSDDNGVLAQSRALGKLDQQMHTVWNTLSLLDYLAKCRVPSPTNALLLIERTH